MSGSLQLPPTSQQQLTEILNNKNRDPGGENNFLHTSSFANHPK